MIFAISKPRGWTSHDAINYVRRALGVKKVGHAGTLDPMATGVLVIGVGRASTRKLSEITSGTKEYLATICLGATSNTDDAEGEISKVTSPSVPTRSQVATALKDFIGHIKQTPPTYSALKIKGQRAYALARSGKPVKLEPRPVTVYSLELVSYRWPKVKLKITTGPGVYIRAIARDLGATLKTGGYLSALARTRVGRYSMSQSYPVSRINKDLLGDSSFGKKS